MLKDDTRTGLLSAIPPLRPLTMERDKWLNKTEASYNYETRWSNSISHALRIVALYQHGNWPSQAFLEGDAITLFPILWTAASFLSLALMRSGPVDATEKIALLDALDSVMIQLTQASRHWGIARLFLCEWRLPSSSVSIADLPLLISLSERASRLKLFQT